MPLCARRPAVGSDSTLTVAIPVVFVTLVMIRFAFVFLMALVSGQLSENRGWLVAAWAGTRGPISALAAFTVPVATDAGDRIPLPGTGDQHHVRGGHHLLAAGTEHRLAGPGGTSAEGR